jgi:uncharacterized membrane protein YczE
MQVTLWVLPPISGFLAQLAVLVGGILLVAIASGLYIGARFGPGPRDGLMTGLRSRFGMPIWAARASVELTVLVIGWTLGGTVGLGTVLFAATIGPLVHITLPLFDTARTRATSPRIAVPAAPVASPR